MSPVDQPRVGYVLKMYPRLSETFIVTEIAAHEAAGAPVEIFSLRSPVDGRFHGSLAQIQAEVTYLPSERLRASELWHAIGQASAAFPGIWHELESMRDEEDSVVYQAVLLAQAVRDRSITHLHAHFGTVAAAVARGAARIAGVPYSFTAHAKDIFHDSVDPEDLRRKLRDASTVVTVSDYNLKYLQDRYGGDARTVRRIYNGLDLHEFAFQSPENRPPLIVGVGRLIEKKGFSDLIDACRTLADRECRYTCEILGGGAFSDSLATQIQQLGLEASVKLLGPRSRGEVIAKMQEAAVLAAPCVVGSDGNRDGLPTVLLEAMALGTPCISTDVTGIPEVIRHERTGLLVKQHDAAGLADQLQRLLEDAALRERLAVAARGLIESEFDIHRNTAEMRKVFQSTGDELAGTAREVA